MLASASSSSRSPARRRRGGGARATRGRRQRAETMPYSIPHSRLRTFGARRRILGWAPSTRRASRHARRSVEKAGELASWPSRLDHFDTTVSRRTRVARALEHHLAGGGGGGEMAPNRRVEVINRQACPVPARQPDPRRQSFTPSPRVLLYEVPKAFTRRCGRWQTSPTPDPRRELPTSRPGAAGLSASLLY